MIKMQGGVFGAVANADVRTSPHDAHDAGAAASRSKRRA